MNRTTITSRTVIGFFLVGVLLVLSAPGGAGAAATKCAITGPVTPTPSAAAPPPAALASFAVLVRPGGPADQIPVVNDLGLELAGQLGSYDSMYVRLLAALPGNRQLFVIPGTGMLPVLPPLSCVPAKDRAPLEQAIHEQAKLVSGPVYCLVVVGGSGIFGLQSSACVPFALEPDGYAIDNVGQSAIGHPSRTLAGLVPDGVSSVQLSFFAAPRLTAAVSDNAFVAAGVFRHLDAVERRDAAAERRGFPSRSGTMGALVAKRLLLLQRQVAAAAIPTHVRWLGPAGQVIATFTPPSGRRAQQELGTLSSFTESSASGQSSFGSGIGLTSGT